MPTDPLVSVVIPTYNRAGLICRTIDNILLQTYPRFEIIIVDDGSTDDTQSRLTQYGDRIRVISQSNTGPAIARNRGAGLARGEIIAFQDSDDFWEPTKLERQVALLETDSSIPCCLCGIVMRHIHGKPFTSFDHSLVRLRHEEGIWLNVLDILATRFVLFNQAAAIRRRAFEKVGGFPEDLKYLEDYDLPLRLALEGPWAFIRDPLVIYGERSELSFSEEANKDPVVLTQCEATICERMLALIDHGVPYASARRHLKRRLAITHRRLVAMQLQRTHWPMANAIGKLLTNCDRYRLGLFRRSPWFPQPQTAPFEPVR